MRRSVLTFLAAVALSGAVAGCGSSGEYELVGPGTGLDTTEAEVVTEWVEVENPYDNSFFRTIRINGECFVEELHGGYPSLTLAPNACDR